jgi:hypothetical protein
MHGPSLWLEQILRGTPAQRLLVLRRHDAATAPPHTTNKGAALAVKSLIQRYNSQIKEILRDMVTAEALGLDDMRRRLDNTCVESGTTHDGITGHGHDEPPCIGDPIICVTCGCVMLLTEDGARRAEPEVVTRVVKQLGEQADKFREVTGKEIH